MKNWQRAFVLHNRAYSETSLLVDLFIESKGKVTTIAKGARRKRSSLKGILQPFTPLIIQYSGNGEVKTLGQVEAMSLSLPLLGYGLYSGFYLNELLHRVLVSELDTTELFQAYLESLQQLAKRIEPEKVLRQFEFILLEFLGYRVDFEHCSATGDDIVDEMYYLYQSEQGFISSLMQNSNSYLGKELRAFAAKNFDDLRCLKAAKRFTRQALKPYVGSKPFKSRELFLQP
ncbi:DNA replication and repair protein RecO [Orbus hercynius]|uniref:DNA repair protein RecO n=1 Tax=Orbus hercynius TaxID=593135 RepID=A0A495RCT6_9GAMM|nr:DNA repair protein RecO [Orbus hercynius]RKS85292.1 DNA replication and repair protein RecO [Orbus hercynius]